MSNYRRCRDAGATYFFTVVTYQRKPLLTVPSVRRALRLGIEQSRASCAFSIDAWVLLPDHLHAIWTLPEHDAEFGKRWGVIKSYVSRSCRELLTDGEALADSGKARRELTFWQRRFWEHRIRDDNDFQRHVDYIHYNPVKHALVKRVVDWPYSTFHRYVRDGVYTDDWGVDPGVGVGGPDGG